MGRAIKLIFLLNKITCGAYFMQGEKPRQGEESDPWCCPLPVWTLMPIAY